MPRRIALLGSIGIAAQTLMAFALSIDNPLLLYIAATLAGLGSGAVYVVSIVVLQAWVPESPGMVTGFGLLVGGGGSLFGIYAFELAITLLGGPIPAMAVTGLASGAVATAASLLVRPPPPRWRPCAEMPQDDMWSEDEGCLPTVVESSSATSSPAPTEFDPTPSSRDAAHCVVNASTAPCPTDESTPLLSHKPNPQSSPSDTRLSVGQIFADPAFLTLFVSVSAAVGPGFGFVLAFPRMMQTLFATLPPVATKLLFYVTLAGVVGRILVGLAIDLQSPQADTQGFAFLGAKRINTVLLATQSMALALMPICILYGASNMFTLCASMVFVTFSGGAVLQACLARSLFSPEDATMAFALLGVAIGVGRAVFSLLVAACGSADGADSVAAAAKLVHSFSERRMYQYDAFLHASFLVSAIGLIASYYVAPSKTVYRNGANSPVFADSVS